MPDAPERSGPEIEESTAGDGAVSNAPDVSVEAGLGVPSGPANASRSGAASSAWQ